MEHHREHFNEITLNYIETELKIFGKSTRGVNTDLYLSLFLTQSSMTSEDMEYSA